MSPATSRTSNALPSAKMRRPYKVAEAIKSWIVEQGLQPGDKLPPEPELMALFGMSKGTIRETTRVLEAQGLIVTRTGPKGGAFINAVSEPMASSLLSNYFFFNKLSIKDIYQLRKLLEPELVASLAGNVSEQSLIKLEANLEKYSQPALDAEDERKQHIDSLQFHIILAELAGNELLGFIIRFMVRMLTDLTVYRRLYEPHNHELWEQGFKHQKNLIQALREGRSEEAREIMREHMEVAQKLMESQEAEMERRFMLHAP
ncbi:FadR/GntR family transcriptional regulator [Enterovibrio nigricans]|uniref:DNA-binding transcriptional regulator, FadR family n=1 Tax=Enterovibrio nigricans DSM 22720 TaxID=1121868 RepID=A0A1T4VUY9_9GAMM|nr:FCD domain-containing protein [Enterovibrio nigricans]PKF49323.1 FadR family transcriptional regulator [Enterovibrio nigricans]SKA68665.1 DNA-binding transcriptional regulator, FadR family [Enterovibrio nigricans DSM 22720]